jgi:hypothetical protein
MRFESGPTYYLNSTAGEGKKVHRSIGCSVGKEKAMKCRVCNTCVNGVVREFGAYREPPKTNKLRFINTADYSDFPRLHHDLSKA